MADKIDARQKLDDEKRILESAQELCAQRDEAVRLFRELRATLDADDKVLDLNATLARIDAFLEKQPSPSPHPEVPTGSTCGFIREDARGRVCSNPFHLPPRPWPTTPEEAADRAVGHCRHVTVGHPHDWACAVCIAYWIGFIEEPPRKSEFPPHNHEPGSLVRNARCPGCEAVKDFLEKPPAPEVQSEDSAFKEGAEAMREAAVKAARAHGALHAGDEKVWARDCSTQIESDIRSLPLPEKPSPASEDSKSAGKEGK